MGKHETSNLHIYVFLRFFVWVGSLVSHTK